MSYTVSCQSLYFGFVEETASAFVQLRKKKRKKREINLSIKIMKMALKLNPTITQSPKFPAFALPQMASLRSPKFFMASTLRSGSKSVFIASTFLYGSFVWFHVIEMFLGSGLFLFFSLIWFFNKFCSCYGFLLILVLLILPNALSYAEFYAFVPFHFV